MSQTKERAECVGQCIQDCKEDCSDPDIVGEDNDNRGGDNWKTICGSQCDKDCLDECEDVEQEKDEERKATSMGSREQEDGGLGDDAQDETTGGRPYKRNVPNEEPPKWNALDDEDPDEPSDGSGKACSRPCRLQWNAKWTRSVYLTACPHASPNVKTMLVMPMKVPAQP